MIVRGFAFLSLTGFLAAPAALFAAAAEDRWTPALSMEYHRVSSVAISPDGALVAFGLTVPLMDGNKSEYRTQVHVVPTAGGDAAAYTTGGTSATAPQFSPDGRYLAFLRAAPGDGGKPQVWLLPLAGGEAFPLTRAGNGARSFGFSPDGRSVAYVMSDPETEEEKTRKEEKRDVGLVDRNFKYGHLYVALVTDRPDPDAEDRRLTAGEFHVTGWDWSSSDRIVFSHQDDPRINTSRRSGDLSVVHLADGAVRLLHGGGGIESGPRVSPDGQTVAFRSTGDRPEPIGLGDVYLMPVMGGERVRLAETPDRSPGILGWSRDGALVYVTEAERTARRLFGLPADGGPAFPLTPGQGVFPRPGRRRRGGWSSLPPRDAGDAVGGLRRRSRRRGRTACGLRAAPADRSPSRRAASRNGKDPRSPIRESPDGTPVEGLLTLPVGYEEGRRYPLILNVHGGPAGVYSESFTGAPGIYMLQYFAQEGFAILRPNPRGSTGYGKDFRYANFKDWGFGDLDDLLAGVTWWSGRGSPTPRNSSSWDGATGAT